jgi:hypothetical protein
MPGKILTSILLDPAEFELIREVAAKTGKSKSQLIHEAISFLSRGEVES